MTGEAKGEAREEDVGQLLYYLILCGAKPVTKGTEVSDQGGITKQTAVLLIWCHFMCRLSDLVHLRRQPSRTCSEMGAHKQRAR